MTLFFSVVNNIHTSANTLSQDLHAMTNWLFQWTSAQAREVIFSRKIEKLLCPTLLFNNILFLCNNSLSQKRLGSTLDIKLNLLEHRKNISKNSKTMALLRKFQPILTKSSLLTISKTFERNRLDSVDFIYDQAYISAFHDKLETVQYNACLGATGAIRGTLTEKLYRKLGLESLKSRR